jgi:soluble lytic murein transglycosylase-like protein
MADDLDRFLLQYVVEQREALRRLEELNRRVENVGSGATKSKSKIKEFAADATAEVGKLVPGLDRVSTAIRAITSDFSAAAVGAGTLAIGLGAIAIGTKSVIDMRERYNKQRSDAMDIGVSNLRLEEYQRKFVKASGGNITREQTTDEIRKLSQFTSAVFRDPTRIGQEARTARVLGIDMGQPGQHISVNEIMGQLGAKFSKMTDAQVQAQAKVLGMNQDFALGLKRQGPDVTKITELSKEEIENRNNAQKDLDKFNEAFARLKDNFIKAENVLGEKLLPPFLKFVEAMGDLSEKLPKAADAVGEVATESFKPFGLLKMARKKFFPTDEEKAAKQGSQADKVEKKNAAAVAKDNAKTSTKLKDLVDGEFDRNAEARNIADSQALAINQFAGAVASFSNAVDERQAWAAWAGEIGKASGLAGPKASLPTLPETASPSSLDSLFKEAAEKYKKQGITESLLKNVARVESGFNPNAVSPVGATGLMQIMPSNFKGLGITNPKDPRQNIMGGADLLADYLKRSGGDINKALMMYHGGLDTSNWGPLTKAYPGKVLGAANDAKYASGESRDKINLKSVQNTIAGRLGVPVAQLQQGMVNRGDVEFASSQIRSGIQNNIYDMQNQLKAVNLPQQVRSKMMTELRNQQSGLVMMRNYSGQVENTARPGERSITIGERAIIINVNGANDPSATATEVKQQFDDHLGELVNGYANGAIR